MKFIHLADLHIGKIVNGFSLIEDQVFILDQILQYVRKHKPQAVVISGDVYDKTTPGTEAVSVFDQFLTDLVREKVAVLVISGNHDSPERLSFAHRIMNKQNVYLGGVFTGRLQTVSFQDEHGETCFYLMPFLKPSLVRRFFADVEVESYHGAVKAVIESVKLDKNKRHVLIAHQFMISPGNEPERSESEVGPVGGIDSIDISMLLDFDYVALGHLHGPQKVGPDHIRYAGSPLKYSFSERQHKKSAALVELGKKGALTITLLPLTPLRDMRKIKGPLAELTSEAVIAQGPPRDYLHIALTDEEEIVDAIGKVRSVYPNIMILTFENTRTETIADLSEISSLDDATPMELFGSFFFAQNGREMNPRQAAIVDGFLKQMGDEV